MKTVKEIYDFFLQFFSNGGKHLSLMDFMNTVPGFLETKENGIGSMNVSLGMEYYRICEKMVDDLLLMRIKANPMMGIMTQYLAVHSANSSDPQAFNLALDYGAYDFKYRGFVYTRDYFTHSVLQIEGQYEDLRLDTGTAYYLGNNLFATAAHCVNDVARFNLLLPDDTPLPLRDVWFAKDQDREVYDLAIIRVDGELTIPYFMMDAPAVLDEVLVMGFPPIANLPSIQTAETATIGAYQKASTGQVVANTTAYRTQMDFFLINARVRGGNSGGPVINKEGKVVGTVVALLYELESDPDNPRYDIMGYGQCLPSKYIEELLTNPEQLPLHEDGKYYSFR